MPRDTMSEDMSNGLFEARKVPGSGTFNVYSRFHGHQVGFLFVKGEDWYAKCPDERDEPFGPYSTPEEAFKAIWGNF
jgi:hypothetical protein